MLISPVSYTHLDVYKRQELQIRVQKLGVAGLTAEEKQSYIRILTERSNRS